MRFCVIVHVVFFLASASQSIAFVSLKSRPRRVGPIVASTRRGFLRESIAAATGVVSPGLWVPSLPAGASAATASPLGGLIDLPPMGLGAWAWGDPIFWGYNPSQDEELRRVFDYAVANSNSERTLFDTAELYGLGRSESLLGAFSKDCGDKVAIATKFAALPFRLSASDVVKACEASVKRLGRPIDLYQIHFPNAWSNAEYWDGLAMVYEKGLVKSVGVSNYGSDALRACHQSLSQRGIALATNQIQYSLLYRWPEANGLIDTCRELNIKVLAYSPLALGFLTGKYNTTHLPDGPRSALGKQLFQTPDFDNLIDTMKVLASHHDDATVSQVAINWARAKGTIPIPGARTISQVQQNYGALEWNLSPKDVEALDEAAARVSTFITPDKSPFPREDIKTHLEMFDS